MSAMADPFGMRRDPVKFGRLVRKEAEAGRILNRNATSGGPLGARLPNRGVRTLSVAETREAIASPTSKDPIVVRGTKIRDFPKGVLEGFGDAPALPAPPEPTAAVPKAAATAVSQADQAAQEAAEVIRRRTARGRGRGSTIIAAQSGGDVPAGAVRRKTLLGGAA